MSREDERGGVVCRKSSGPLGKEKTNDNAFKGFQMLSLSLSLSVFRSCSSVAF